VRMNLHKERELLLNHLGSFVTNLLISPHSALSAPFLQMAKEVGIVSYSVSPAKKNQRVVRDADGTEVAVKEGEWVDQVWGLLIEAMNEKDIPSIAPTSDQDMEMLGKEGKHEDGFMDWLSEKTSSFLHGDEKEKVGKEEYKRRERGLADGEEEEPLTPTRRDAILRKDRDNSSELVKMLRSQVEYLESENDKLKGDEKRFLMICLKNIFLLFIFL